MKEYPERLKDIRYPKIKKYNSTIEIADRHFPWYIWKCVFALAIIVFLIVDNRYTPPLISLLILLLLLFFLWDTFSLNKVTIDFKSKVFRRSNTNPLVLFMRKFSQIPEKIYFTEIENIYPGDNEAFRSSDIKYIVFIRTNALNKLPIGHF